MLVFYRIKNNNKKNPKDIDVIYTLHPAQEFHYSRERGDKKDQEHSKKK